MSERGVGRGPIFVVRAVRADEELPFVFISAKGRRTRATSSACVGQNDGAVVFARSVSGENGLGELVTVSEKCGGIDRRRTREKGAHCVMAHEKPVNVVKKVAPATLE